MTALIPMILAGMLAVEPGPGSDDRPRERRGQPQDISKLVGRIAEAVDASDEQIAQLEAIASEHENAAEQARAARADAVEEHGEELKDLRRQMREARKAGEGEQVEDLRKEIQEIVGGPPRGLMRETRAKIAEVLMPEQQEIFEELMESQRKGKRRRGNEAGRKGRGPENIHHFIRRVAEEIDATKEQRKELRIIAAEHKEAVVALQAERDIARKEHRDELKELREELSEARESGDKDAVKEIRGKFREIMGRSQMEIMERTNQKIAGILTEEQAPRFQAFLEETRKHAGERSRERRRKHGK